MNPSRHGIVLAALLALGLCAGAATAEVRKTTLDAPQVEAVWLEQEHNFTYFGQTTYYSCYGLRDKVSYLLRELGARPGYKVRVSCVESGGSGIERMPNVRIRAAFPVEATPERLQQLAADASRRELVARVRGQDAQSEGATARFPARWQQVEFQGWHDDRIAEGDCELLEQLVDRVFVPMGLRVAADSRLACMRNQVPVGSVRLRLETLQKVPEPDAAAK
jgi:hypothetical protein